MWVPRANEKHIVYMSSLPERHYMTFLVVTKRYDEIRLVHLKGDGAFREVKFGYGLNIAVMFANTVLFDVVYSNRKRSRAGGRQ